jgi:hypothetical protein
MVYCVVRISFGYARTAIRLIFTAGSWKLTSMADEKNITAEELQQIMKDRLDSLDTLLAYISENKNEYPELNGLLNSEWEKQVRNSINSMTVEDPSAGNESFHLLSALTYYSRGPEFWIKPIILEKRLQRIRKQAKNGREYNKIKGDLVSNYANQIHGALFELAVLSVLLEIDSSANLHVRVGNSGKNVDAVITVDGREIYCECTIRGYSTHDHYQGPSDPYQRPCLMVKNTLDVKCGKDGQLALVANDHPTVLFTCVGFDIMTEHYDPVIQNALELTKCSMMIVFDRYHCEKFKVFTNSESPKELTNREIEKIEKGLIQYLGSIKLPTHIDSAS